jgi:hypothetical protein
MIPTADPFRPQGPAGVCVWRRLLNEEDRAVARVDGQNRVQDQRPVAVHAA